MSNPIMPVSGVPKIHILFADDDEMILRLYSTYLVEAGFEVIHAHDGNEAREIARRFKPDIIITDNRMPIVDGISLISTLHHEKETANIPIILLTNDDLSLEAEKVIFEIGAFYVSKAQFKTHIWEALSECITKIGKPSPVEYDNFVKIILGSQ